jgi:Ni,Fe-hydrogenase I cytochrome b subunit
MLFKKKNYEKNFTTIHRFNSRHAWEYPSSSYYIYSTPSDTFTHFLSAFEAVWHCVTEFVMQIRYSSRQSCAKIPLFPQTELIFYLFPLAPTRASHFPNLYIHTFQFILKIFISYAITLRLYEMNASFVASRAWNQAYINKEWVILLNKPAQVTSNRVLGWPALDW